MRGKSSNILFKKRSVKPAKITLKEVENLQRRLYSCVKDLFANNHLTLESIHTVVLTKEKERQPSVRSVQGQRRVESPDSWKSNDNWAFKTDVVLINENKEVTKLLTQIFDYYQNHDNNRSGILVHLNEKEYYTMDYHHNQSKRKVYEN